MATESAGLRINSSWIAQLRSAMWSAGYQTARVSDLLGAEPEHLQPDPAQAILLKRHLPANAPISTLIRLFMLGLGAPQEEVAAALAPLSLEHAHELGVIEEGAGDQVRGAVRITPFRDFLFACSRVPDMNAVERNHVMGVTRSSINLANLTVRKPVELALDLGAGCGFQAMFVSRHATRVIAVDINPLALQFTELNARLNGVDNVECREGDYLEPVAGESFDLVVSNPPFVISPDARFLYRDSGMAGDELSRRIVGDVAGVLRPGGLATVMVSWGRKAGDEWDATPRRWVAGTGCDVWILHQATQPSLNHAASWHQPLAARDLRAYDEGVQRWTDYTSGLGFDAIAYGAVILRRREGANWIRSEEMPEPDSSPAGEQLVRMTAAQDMLAGLTDRRALLDARFSLVAGHRLDQTLRCTNGSYSIERAVLQVTDGLPFRANVDAFNAYLLTRLDGTRTLREAIGDTVQAAPMRGMEADEIETATLRSVRRMLELGFIEFKGAD
jgi:methylase of polypeptide subunit release factors